MKTKIVLAVAIIFLAGLAGEVVAGTRYYKETKSTYKKTTYNCPTSRYQPQRYQPQHHQQQYRQQNYGRVIGCTGGGCSSGYGYGGGYGYGPTSENLLWGLGGAVIGGLVGYMAGERQATPPPQPVQQQYPQVIYQQSPEQQIAQRLASTPACSSENCRTVRKESICDVDEKGNILQNTCRPR